MLTQLLKDFDDYAMGIKSLEWYNDRALAPQFSEARKVHDWRNHVDEPLQKHWDTLSMETRIILILLARQRADNEVWE